MDSGSRKRLRRSKDNDGCDSQDQQSNGTNIDDRKFDVPFPKNLEARFATAIFELGLKNSSPKVLMPLMPTDTNLSTEHIKSHLQKYRIHRQRSKDEFLRFYEEYMKESYQHWENLKGWKKNTQHEQSSDHSLGDNYNNFNNIQHINSLNSITGYHDNLQHNNNYSPSIENTMYQFQQSEQNNNNIHEFQTTTTDHTLTNLLQTTDNITPSTNDLYNHNNNQPNITTDSTSGYVKELYRETELLLNNLQVLCQEVVQSEDALKDQININNIYHN